jgi:hypothetical protein
MGCDGQKKSDGRKAFAVNAKQLFGRLLIGIVNRFPLFHLQIYQSIARWRDKFFVPAGAGQKKTGKITISSVSL